MSSFYLTITSSTKILIQFRSTYSYFYSRPITFLQIWVQLNLKIPMLHPSRSLLIPSFINPILDLLYYQPFISSLYNSFFTIQLSSIHLSLFMTFYHCIILFTSCCIYYNTLQLKTNQKSNKQKNKTQVNSNIHFATVQPLTSIPESS